MQRFIWLTAILLIGFLLTACHPNIDIIYENRTDQTLLLDVNGGGFEEIDPLTADTITYLVDDGDRFEITIMTEDGDVLFHEVFTEDELEEIGNRIIIEEPSSSRPLIPEATNALPP